MKILVDDNLRIGWVAGRWTSPRMEAAFIVKGTFRLVPGGTALPGEGEPELLSGDRHREDDPARSLEYASDLIPFKPRGDILLAAAAHAPGGRPAPAVEAGLRIGGLAKKIYVLGDRAWKRHLLGRSLTDPAPFTMLPIVYENAFGGPGWLRNPVGKGRDGTAAPNIEDPRRMTAGPSDDAPPAGFGPVSPGWLPRKAMAGTYKGKYVRERWPWPPEDFDWAYHNSAPPDQQVPGYFRGDEEVELTNLHPLHPLYFSRLPGCRARLFLDERLDGKERFREVPLRLDTIWIEPASEKLLLVWRGSAEVPTAKLRGVERVLALLEPLAGAPRSLDACAAELRHRMALEEGEGEEEGPQDAGDDGGEADLREMEEEIAAAEKEIAAAEAGAGQARAEEREALIAAGADPAALDPAPADLAALRAALAAALPAWKEAVPDAAPADLGIEELDGLAAAEAAGEAGEAPALTREEVQAAAAAGRSLAEADLSGLDLSGLDLRGLDLAGADLTKAILQGTRLGGSSLAGADLTGANIAGADLTGAILDEADLSEANLAGACLAGASLRWTALSGLAIGSGDFTGCRGKGADFSRSDLAGARFEGAELPGADFSGAKLAGADFRKADLASADFEGAKGPGIRMEGSSIGKLKAGDGADFTGGRFDGARGPGSIWEGSVLDGAVFDGALLGRALFEEASLKEARFDRADLASAVFEDACLRKAILTRANLLRAAFARADLTGADLRGSNLYEAAFAEAAVEGILVAEADRKKLGLP